jgi:hypothetical protein
MLWESDFLDCHVTNNVVNAAVGLERALRAVPQPLRGLWQCIHDALAAVERCHDRVLAHYQWRERVKGTATTWPWEWPNVPPIAPALLDALDKSASRLTGFVQDFASRRTPLAGAVAGKRSPAATAPVEGEDAGTEEQLPLPALMSAPDLARSLGLSEDQVDSFLRRYRTAYPDCYIENESPRKTDPKYLYRTADVLPVLTKRRQQQQ